MPALLRKVSLFIICFFIIANILAQKNKTKTSKNIFAESEFDKTHPQTIPDGVRNDDILNYLINERQYIQFFTFGKDTTRIQIDSLLPKYTEYIDSFIKRYKNQKYAVPEELKSPPFKAIYDTISNLFNINYKDRSPLKFNEVLLAIDRLPDSRQKVELFLEYAGLNIHNETYYTDVYSLCDKAKKIADGINDLYEKGKAYTSIGDYFYKSSDFAIRMYYLARESFANCKRDSITKYNEEGFLCEKLAWLFYPISLQQAIQKEIYYFEIADYNFKKTRNYKEENIAGLYFEAATTNLWIDYLRYDAGNNEQEQHAQNLKDLQNWYTRLRGIDNEANYLGFFSIAIVSEGKSNKAALLYYLNALYHATFELNLSQVIISLQNISRIYTSLEKPNLAIEYSNLEQYVADKTQSNLEFNTAFVDKAFTFYGIKEYDSALIYADRVISDTSLKSIFYPAFYNQILENAYLVKYQVLDSLKQNSDSAREYQLKYIGYQTAHLQDLVNLIEVESESSNAWFERSKATEMEKEKERTSIAIKNTVLQTKLKKQEERLRIQAQQVAQQALKEKNYYATLAKLKDSLRISDSAMGANKLITQLKIEKQKDKIREQEKFIYGGGGAFLFLAGIIGFVLWRKRNKDKNKKLGAEFERVNGLAKNKIHNIENDYSEIGYLLETNQIEKLKQYNEEYEGFLAVFLANWKKEQVTLEDELIATKRYYKTKAILNDKLSIKIENNVNKPQKVKFIQSVFDTLLDNSVRHGLTNKDDKLKFNILIKREDTFLLCEITDDGIPPLDDGDYMADKNSGLNILKSRILNFYIGNKIKPKSDFFKVKSRNEKQGTSIIIKIPYEEV